jgi:predicted nucleic acid-binding protein
LERDDASGEKENLNPCGRNRHHRSTSAVDLMIAATAAHHGLTVLHDDADYRTAVARHAPDMAEHNIHDTV